MTPGPVNGLVHRSRSSIDPTPAFREYFESQKEEGTDGTTSSDDDVAHYLPENALRRYFSVDHIPIIYNQIYPHHAHVNIIPMYEPLHVRSKYRKVLATLLYIGKAELLDAFLSDESLNDKHLPFYERSARFPGTEQDFDDFFEAQWKFCVLAMEYRHIADWHERQILPYKVQRRRLGEGNTGKACLIKIHPAHNKLNPTADDQLSRSTDSVHSDQLSKACLNTFVLKEFRPRKNLRERWLDEAKVHVAIRTNDVLTADGGIVGFHGCFKHGGKFSILLEHATRGNLEQLLQSDERPKSYVDILDLWNSYFQLLSTLHCLLRLEYAGRESLQICHFDIKPSNVLLFPGDSGRRFDFRFKLGDLGSSVYCTLVDEMSAKTVHALQKPGTRTYGAPECCRLDPHAPAALLPPNYVQPDADTWSYGCVASELAAWIVRGPGGLKGYREGRRDAHDEAWTERDCFHNGYQTLPYIRKFHDRLMEDMGNNPNNATVAALTIIERDMLQFEPTHRMKPLQLMHKSKAMMDQVQKNILLPDPSSSVGSIPNDERPEMRQCVSAPVQLSESVKTAATPHIRGTSDVGVKTSRLVDRNDNRSSDLYRRNTVEPNKLDITRSRRERFSDRRIAVHDRRLTETSDGCQGFPSKREGSTHGAGAGTASQQLDEPGPADDTLENTHLSFLARTDTGSFTESAASESYGPSVYDHSNQVGLVAEPETYFESPETHSDPRLPNWPVNNVMAQSTQPALERLNDSLPPKTPDRLRGNQVPVLKVHNALSWKAETNSQSFFSKLRKRADKEHHMYWRQLSQEFEDSDFVVLVDDSLSMRRYWRDVEDCAGLLAFCTRRYDKDGIDLCFMFSDRKKNTDVDRDIEKQIRKNKPPEVQQVPDHAHQKPNINTALGRILRQYQDKVERHNRYGAGGRLKKLVLFVLTNGSWQPLSNAERPISDLVDALHRYKQPEHQVGIQFIRFGDEPEGIWRLQKLDDFLGREKDIVDVEPYPDGNIFKMLLGSINKDFDWADTPTSLSEGSSSPATAGTTASQRYSDGRIVPPSPLIQGQGDDQWTPGHVKQQSEDISSPTRSGPSSQSRAPRRNGEPPQSPPSFPSHFHAL